MKVNAYGSRSALATARHDSNALERYLEEPKNIALKQLLWTAIPLPVVDAEEPDMYRSIANVRAKVQGFPGVKKVVLKEKNAHSAWEDYVF